MPANKLICSLCISIYNRPAALRLCLQSVMAQSVLPYEIIIGDDGSGHETKKLIEEFTMSSPIPVIHVWQPDEGFQLAKIRNKSFAKAAGDYIIQIDGDLILHPKFIEDHIRIAREGTFLCGTKCLLDKTCTDKMTGDNKYFFPSFFSKHLRHRYNAFRCRTLARINYFLQRGKSKYLYVKGANMAFWKKDIIRVNGYNEIFKGWGKEDNELAARLCNAGVKLRFIRFAAITYHLHHQIASLVHMNQNEVLMRQTVDNNVTFTPQGVNAYINK